MPVWGIVAAGAAILTMVAIPVVVSATSPAPVPYVRPSDAFETPTPEPEPVSVLFIGDSYSAGAGASAPSARWTTIASNELGWIENNEARGGTGYVATAGVNGCGIEYCPTYGEVIRDEADLTPSIVVISGGRNDGAQPDYQAMVESTIREAQAKWPGAAVVVTSPIWDDDAAPAWMTASIAAVQAAAAAAGAVYLDIGQPLAGNADLVIAGDGVHPSDAGYAAIAAAFTAAWATTGL